MKSFYCLLVQGGNLGDGVRDALYMTAAKMLRMKKARMKFTDEMAQGRVVTEGNRRTLSSAISGIEFNATVDCKNGNSIVCRFLVDDRNLLSDETFFEGGVSWLRGSTIISDDDEGEEWKKADD